MFGDFQGDSWGSIPPLRMSSLLPHDLCHGQSTSLWPPTSYLGHRGLSEKETSCMWWPGSFSSCVVGNVFIQDLSLLSRSVVSDTLQPNGLWSTRLLYGIVQVRILEWVAIPSSRGFSWPRDPTRVSCISCIDRWILYQLCHLGSPWMLYRATKESYINQCSHISEKKKFLSQWRLRTRIITFFQLEKFNKWLPQSIILLIDLDFNIIPVFEKLSFLLIQRLYE